MIEIIVQLSKDAINRIIHDQTDPLTNELDEIITAMKVNLKPLHSEHLKNKDNELGSWFNIQVDEEKADGLIMNLNNCSEVIAAYKKPQAEPP